MIDDDLVLRARPSSTRWKRERLSLPPRPPTTPDRAGPSRRARGTLPI